jgi:hypothetical protein
VNKSRYVMDLDKSTHEIIKHDSVASIETEGVLGNQFVAISFGSAGQAEVKDGEIIQSEPPLEMSDLLKKTSGILDSSQQAIQNATEATAHLNSVSAKIDSGQGTVGALVNDKQLYSNLEQTTATLHDTMLQAQTGVTDFQENMEALKHNFFLSGYFKKRGYEDSADLAANKIGGLPQGTPLKAFTYTGQATLRYRDSAKLKNQKSLNAAATFWRRIHSELRSSWFQPAWKAIPRRTWCSPRPGPWLCASTWSRTSALTTASSRRLGMGKQTGANLDADWGSIQILIFPAGTEIPADKIFALRLGRICIKKGGRFPFSAGS